TWASCSGTQSADSWDILSNGTIAPRYAATEDLLLGGTSTSTAKFAVLNIAGGIPAASVSAQNAANQALVLGSDGSIQTVRNQTLTIGGGTTGDIKFKPGNATNSLYLSSTGNVGINTTSPNGPLDINGTTADGNWQLGVKQKSNGNTIVQIQRATDSGPTGDAFSYVNAADNTQLFKVGNSGDVTAGSLTTITTGGTSGDIIVAGVLRPSSGYYVIRTAATSGKSVAIQNASSAEIASFGGGGGLYLGGSTTSGPTNMLDVNGNAAIGVNAAGVPALAALDVRGNSGASIASFSATAANTLGLIVDNTSGNLISASSSGATQFVVKNGGSVLASSIDNVNANQFLIGNGNATGVTIGKSGVPTTIGNIGAAGVALLSSGGVISTGTVDLSSATYVANTLGVSNGGTGTGTSFTQGSLVFAGASGVYTQDNANLFYQSGKHYLGLGTTAPTAPLSVVGATLVPIASF